MLSLSYMSDRDTPIHVATSPQDQWIKIIATTGNIRGVAIQAGTLVQSLCELHQVNGNAAQGFGEAIMGALLISSYCKSGERVNLNIQGSGYIRQALVDAYPDGSVRGYVSARTEEPDLSTAEGEPIGPWGAGMLSVLRTKEGQAQPYIGTVPLVTGHLAKDLTFYWAQSEQVPSAVGLAVNFENGKVVNAGGFLIQALPGASPVEVAAIERHINDLESLASQIAKNADPLLLLSHIFQSMAFVIIEKKALSFKCQCSWERVQRALALVGVSELQAMLKEDNKAVVRCDFCTKEYEVGSEELQEMIDDAAGPGSRDPNSTLN